MSTYSKAIEARDLHLVPERCRELASDSHRVVRINIARNPATSPDVLELLADDEDMWVRDAVLFNFRTPTAGLRKLVDREAASSDKPATTVVRELVLLHPNVGDELRLHLDQAGVQPPRDVPLKFQSSAM